MNEREGSERLREIFNKAGCEIARDVPFVLDAGTVTLDGWDAARRVGFEFITTEAGDRAEFTSSVLAELEARIERGELHLLIIDEALAPRPESLDRAAGRFLELLGKRGVLR